MEPIFWLLIDITRTDTPASGCTNEQMAAGVLGYTQASWDNLSGQEPQPPSATKAWAALTAKEKASARVLGYTQAIWNNESGVETRPTSANKQWDWLTSCGEGLYMHDLYL